MLPILLLLLAHPTAGTHHFASVRPTSATAADRFTSTSTQMLYGGGPVMHGPVKLYFVWYGNWINNTAPAILADMAASMGGSPWMNIVSTYRDSVGPASAAVSFGGAIFDSYSRGASISDADVLTIVVAGVVTGGLPKDPNGIYLVLTSADVGEGGSGGFCAAYCGWHDTYVLGSTPIRYGFVGNSDRCPQGCSLLETPTPNGNAAADGMVNIVAHEVAEALTDPSLNAWSDATGDECADVCAWAFGTTYTAANGGAANVRWGARDFLVQRVWVNSGASSACVLGYGSATPSPVSVSASRPPSGSPSAAQSGSPTGSRVPSASGSPSLSQTGSNVGTPSTTATASTTPSPSATVPVCAPESGALTGPAGSLAGNTNSSSSGSDAAASPTSSIWSSGSCSVGVVGVGASASQLISVPPGGAATQALFTLDLGFVPPAGSQLTVNTCVNTSWDSVLFVGDADDGGGGCPSPTRGFSSLNCVAANDDACGPWFSQSSVTVGFTSALAPQHLTILMSGYTAADVGPFVLAWAYAPPPASTPTPTATPSPAPTGSPAVPCASIASPLYQLGPGLAGSTTGVLPSPPNASSFASGSCSGTAVLPWSPGVLLAIDLGMIPPPGSLLLVDTCGGGTSFDSMLYLGSGCPAVGGAFTGLHCLAANDDACGLASRVNLTSSIAAPLPRVVYVWLASFHPVGGAFALEWSLAIPSVTPTPTPSPGSHTSTASRTPSKTPTRSPSGSPTTTPTGSSTRSSSRTRTGTPSTTRTPSAPASHTRTHSAAATSHKPKAV